MKNLALLGLVLSLAACPGPGEGGSRLIGTWDELAGPLSDGGDEPSVATFHADGSYELLAEEPEAGTFEEVGDTLILTSDTGIVDEVPYATDGSLFTPAALRRVNAGTGFSGRWLAEGSSEGKTESMALALESDDTFTLEVGEDVLSGTWRDDNGVLITTLQFPDGSLELPWHSIDDAITLFAFERR